MTDRPVHKKKKPVKGDIPQNRSFRTQSLADASRPLLAPILKRRGFSSIEIVTKWPSIVGEHIARYCAPLKLNRPRFEGHECSLLVRVVSGGFALELKHQEPQILERINAYFGYRAVDRLIITQGPLPECRSHTRPLPLPVRPSLPEAAQQRLNVTLANITDPDLHAALANLGAWVLTENSGKKEN